MSRSYEDITKTIRKTPLVELGRIVEGTKAEVCALRLVVNNIRITGEWQEPCG